MHDPPGKENSGASDGGPAAVAAAPSAGMSIKAMFEHGVRAIETQRKEDVFKSMAEGRTLTEAEQAIIQQRVDLQRRMLAAFEAQERVRKIDEVRAVCPTVTEAEAARAVELCRGDEGEAAAALASGDHAFVRRVRAGLRPDQVSGAGGRIARPPSARRGGGGGGEAAVVEEEPPAGAAAAEPSAPSAAAPPPAQPALVALPLHPARPRPAKAPLTSLGDGVFIGAFRGGRVKAADGSWVPGGGGGGARHPRPRSAGAGAIPSIPTPASSAGGGEDAPGADAGLNPPVPVPGVRKARSPRAGSAGARGRRAAVERPGPPPPPPEPIPHRLMKCLPDGSVVEAGPEEVMAALEAAAAAAAAGGGGGALAPPLPATVPAPVPPPPQAPPQPITTPTPAGEADGEDGDEAAGAPAAPPPAKKSRSGSRVRPPGSRRRRRPPTAGGGGGDPTAAAALPGAAPAAEGGGGGEAATADPTPTTTAAEGAPAPAPPLLDASAAAAAGGVPVDASSLARPLRGRSLVAIARSGHVNRGRLRLKSSKHAELVSVGALRTDAGWHNAGYIFPDGFISRVSFRSSVALDQLTVHECAVVGRGGAHWPAPTFVVTAADRPDEPLVAKSCTGCWSAVLRRINGAIALAIAGGADLPPPPKTAIAGPEYFGFCQPEIAEAIEALDPGHACAEYWAGKAEREAVAAAVLAGLPPPPQVVSGAGAPRGSRGGGGGTRAPRAPRPPRSSGVRRSRKRSAVDEAGGGGGDDGVGGSSSDEGGFGAPVRRGRPAGTGRPPRGRPPRGGRAAFRSDDDGEDEDDPEARIVNAWGGISRAERYRARAAARDGSGDGGSGDGGAGAGADPAEDDDNPVPHLIDPITLEPVSRPAISPWGHVMGLATWKAVLAGPEPRCPFTKQPLSWEQCTVLTHANIGRFRDRIK